MQPLAVINAGSSSIKFAVFEDADGFPVLFRGQMEKLGVEPTLIVKDAEGQLLERETWAADRLDHVSATHVILETALRILSGRRVRAVGHRVVHGGTQFSAPILIDADVIANLRKLCPLAPLHQPHNLAAIQAIADAVPDLRQVACFDTAFHRSQPEITQQFALPRDLSKAGVRRYGFHGISYEFVSGRLRKVAPALAGGRVIIAHLGNGSSLCAINDGRSVATTMGFTAVDGLMMGTRCGALDPGVLIYLMDERGMDSRAIEDLLYKRSGLLGVSGISSDMQTLRASSDPAAAAAIELFAYRIIREIGSLTAALGGIDAIVFTGGIGQNDWQTRRDVANDCEWLGLRIDEQLNKAGELRIDGSNSAVAAFVIATDEERMIADHTVSVLATAPRQPAMS